MKVKCDCPSKFQDKVHGQGIRVASPVNKSSMNGVVQTYRCSVCGREHHVSPQKKK